VSTEHLRESAIFTQRYVVTPGEEQAVIIGIRDYNRLIERLNGCKPGGWADLWLAGASAGVAVLISALVGALMVAGLALILDGALAFAVWAAVPGTGRLRRSPHDQASKSAGLSPNVDP